jgi:hydroxyacylglutathione hydrolase
MLQITPVPAFRDNYIWTIHGMRGGERVAVLVDPGEPDAILSWLQSHAARPLAVLVTHHHNDHTGALAALSMRWGMPVFGPGQEAIPGVNRAIGEGDRVDIPELDLAFVVMATPGHTLGHVCYLGHGWLFCGDTLFSCGCGRLFEGTAAQMHASLQRLARLPPHTEVYCAHEYTLPNIGFAMAVEPDNPALMARHQQARQLRKSGQATLPTTIGQELASNPFLRCHETTVRVAISHHCGTTVTADVEAFTLLRQWKDHF